MTSKIICVAMAVVCLLSSCSVVKNTCYTTNYTYEIVNNSSHQIDFTNIIFFDDTVTDLCLAPDSTWSYSYSDIDVISDCAQPYSLTVTIDEQYSYDATPNTEMAINPCSYNSHTIETSGKAQYGYVYTMIMTYTITEEMVEAVLATFDE